MSYSFNQTIDDVEYIRTILSERYEIIIPVGGWSKLPTKTFRLRKAMLNWKVPEICQKCGRIGKLDAHHIKPVKYLKNKNGHSYIDPDGDHSAPNGMWLCRPCHNNLHHKKLN